MNIHDLLKTIKKESLTAEEKAAGLSLIKSFIQEHPAQRTRERQADVVSEKNNRPVKSVQSPFWGVLLGKQRLPAMASFMLLLVVITGGTAFAAKYSLPGDILYPIKIHFNEKVESLATIGTKAKTEVKIKHVIERLKEAEELRDQDRLSEDTQVQIENSFSVKKEEVSQSVSKLKDGGNEKEALEITTRFERSLEKHAGIIMKISKKREEFEIDIKDGELVNALKLFEALGFKTGMVYQWKSKIYKYKDFEIKINEYPKKYYDWEIESLDPESDPDELATELTLQPFTEAEFQKEIDWKNNNLHDLYSLEKVEKILYER